MCTQTHFILFLSFFYLLRISTVCRSKDTHTCAYVWLYRHLKAMSSPFLRCVVLCYAVLCILADISKNVGDDATNAIYVSISRMSLFHLDLSIVLKRKQFFYIEKKTMNNFKLVIIIIKSLHFDFNFRTYCSLCLCQKWSEKTNRKGETDLQTEPTSCYTFEYMYRLLYTVHSLATGLCMCPYVLKLASPFTHRQHILNSSVLFTLSVWYESNETTVLLTRRKRYRRRWRQRRCWWQRRRNKYQNIVSYTNVVHIENIRHSIENRTNWRARARAR